MEFSRQEDWSGLPFHFPGDLSDPGIEAGSPALQVDSFPSEPPPFIFAQQKMCLTIASYSWSNLDVLFNFPKSEISKE